MSEHSPWYRKQKAALGHEQRWFCEAAIKLPEGRAGLLEVSCNGSGVLIRRWQRLKAKPRLSAAPRLIRCFPLTKILHFNFGHVDFSRLPGAVTVGAFGSGELI